MSWDSITLSVLACFGTAILALSQLRELLVKVTEIVHAWHELRRSVHPGPSEGEPSLPRSSPDQR